MTTVIDLDPHVTSRPQCQLLCFFFPPPSLPPFPTHLFFNSLTRSFRSGIRPPYLPLLGTLRSTRNVRVKVDVIHQCGSYTILSDGLDWFMAKTKSSLERFLRKINSKSSKLICRKYVGDGASKDTPLNQKYFSDNFRHLTT